MNKVFMFFNIITLGSKGFTLDIFICEILFLGSLKLRKWKWKPLSYVIAAVSVIVHFVFGFNLPLLPVPGLTPLLVFILSILLQWAIFDCSINRILFNSVAAYATQNLAVNVRSIILSFCKFGGWGRLALRIFLTLAVYVFAYFLYAKKTRHKEFNMSYWRLYVISFISVFTSCTLFAILRRSGNLSVYTYGVLALCCFLALSYQFSTFKNANLDKETATLERLLYYEQKRHEMTQETIDLINIKCHDLKKLVTNMKELLGDKAEALLGDTEKAIFAYDDMVKTGNKNLDLIISEEKHYYRKYGVTINVMADGAQLDFMAPADIYTLFSNALSNAAESAVKEQEGNKYIDLDVHLNGEYVCIKFTNVCTRPVKFANGLPVTSKNDKNYHGYGMKSMEYIATKYGGNMVATCEDNLFTLKIIIKKPS